jgi:hypothetical protein
VAALAPALRACLGAAGPDAFATEAYDGPDGSTRVRVWLTGAAVECRAAGDPEGGVELRPLPGAAPPAPATPAFFLERRCVDARRIDAPDGAVLGWLAYPAC